MVRSLAAVVVEAPLVMTRTPTHLLVCPQWIAADVGQVVSEAGGNATVSLLASAAQSTALEPACPEEISAALTDQGYHVKRTTYISFVQALRVAAWSGGSE